MVQATYASMSLPGISSVEDVLEDARSGKLFILVDDENRENEGDLIVLAEKIKPEHMAFMVRYGTGVVCLAMTKFHMKRLGLNFMEKKNIGENHTAFTTSIDARYGITTGVSAEDRTKTIHAAINKDGTQDDIITPGHVFPVIAHKGGVAQRAGHTEASVEMAKLVGFDHSAVICELVNDDGSMMRLPQLLKFAEQHKIKLTTIDKLISYVKNLN
ncbi:3,4-dihydroxy-2-butanone-4-phosphate synthase [Wolbachia endosymbiont of Carposina sasakii]|jgi:3,4-dihydroxy 2-butanone 4-phosphate synthase|uniref:3,4-dihydroxy-2-butanone 4-phosphate synthase n=2 Tax=Wolbachia TaxID=953 RepID=A0A6I6CJH0_WOLPI|nr:MULTISPECIES: 3,4-dihydroxy-2-butanone-4-phosphate synthase [Wolbachia]MDX5487437.1 3,4-dihydroxy-2-butanone-4-phosphate synthase [Wolbachia endosymbiont of Andrena praecox]MDX5497145.1 3,4-dihydroxy-2-butanone-4-phosphate synthase [Wolbachia endosymbiont of Nomada fabriciana]MDX5497383.1 3,4-dihydroxy-2-butanone-4-phosphate synthase [Wolbachia endosymbiont of Lasioglossum nitidulum]MDX5507259.1 3,4-dihydroxy-2-butanone-4-phosphate synthase [Wolbachia endosymbiont of Hylaeus sinuatus]MDX550